MKKMGSLLLALPFAVHAACDLMLNDAGEYEVGSFEDLTKVGVEDCSLDANYRLTADIEGKQSRLRLTAALTNLTQPPTNLTVTTTHWPQPMPSLPHRTADQQAPKQRCTTEYRDEHSSE